MGSKSGELESNWPTESYFIRELRKIHERLTEYNGFLSCSASDSAVKVFPTPGGPLFLKLIIEFIDKQERDLLQ